MILQKEQAFQIPAYGWRPRKDQMPTWRALVSENIRKATIVAHRRWGKDELALAAMSVHAMRRVGSYLYCLPQYEQARKVLWEMVNWRTQRTRIDDFFPPELIDKRDNQAMKMWLTSGSTLQLVGSNDVDSLLGGGYAGIIMSEAALSDPKAMQLFQPILEESGGFSIQISTPRGKSGRGGAFYRSFLAAKEDMGAGDKTVYSAFLPATATEVFSPAQLTRIKLDLVREHGQVIGEAMFAQEYECSFEAAVVGAVWGAELEELELSDRVRPCKHDRRFPVFTSWDLGVADATVILFWQEIGNEYRLIDAFEGTGIGLDQYIELLRQKHWELGYHYAKHFAPHDIAQREFLRGVSRKDEARRMGLDFTRTPGTRVKTQIAAAAQLIRMMVVNSESEGAIAALERFKGWRYPANKATGQLVETPLHDENSHASSALCTFALNVASKLGVAVDKDSALHSSDMGTGLHQKFDPRDLGPAPFSHEGSVSNLMRGQFRPARGAFG